MVVHFFCWAVGDGKFLFLETAGEVEKGKRKKKDELSRHLGKGRSLLGLPMHARGGRVPGE